MIVTVIDHEASPLYGDFLATAEEAFPPSERRDAGAQAAAFADERYRLEAWLEGGRFIGFLAWWDFEAFRYIEHLAVAAKERSGGYGGAMVRAFISRAARPVYIEIEEPVDTVTRKRLAFYRRLGFKENPGVHVQPPYQQGPGADKGVPMQVLTWPEAIDGQEHKRLLALLRRDVWPVKAA